MPQKHSRNNTDRAAFTYQEKQMVGWGTQKTRIGTDSQQPFGYCCLTLKPVVDPVVSPSGHVYSREAIVEYLLAKTQELKRQRLVYEQQQHDKQDEVQAAVEDEKEKEAQRFIEKQTAAASAGAVAGQGHGPSAEQEKREKYIAQQLSKAIHTDLKTKRENVKKTSFWVPVCTPQAEDTGIDKPDKRPRSPMTGYPLRAKDLLPLPLMSDPDWKDEHDGRGKFLCAVSRKPITSQPTVLIKSTGVVLLESIAKELAYPSMTCPVTGKKFKESDLLHLKGGGTGFSASGEVEAKKHRVTHF